MAKLLVQEVDLFKKLAPGEHIHINLIFNFMRILLTTIFLNLKMPSLKVTTAMLFYIVVSYLL